MSLLGKDALLSAAATLPTERVEVPELGAGSYVVVRGLTGSQRDAFEKGLWIQKGSKRVMTDNVRAKLLVKCLVDDAGALQYTDAHVSAIGNLRADVLERIFDACRRVSGMTEVDLEEKKDPSDPAAGSASPTS